MDILLPGIFTQSSEKTKKLEKVKKKNPIYFFRFAGRFEAHLQHDESEHVQLQSTRRVHLSPVHHFIPAYRCTREAQVRTPGMEYPVRVQLCGLVRELSVHAEPL